MFKYKAYYYDRKNLSLLTGDFCGDWPKNTKRVYCTQLHIPFKV